MKRWIKRIGKITAGMVAFFIISCFVFDATVQFRMSDEELVNLFSSHHVPGEVRYFSSHDRIIRYVSVGNDTLPTVVFIHGAPSSLRIYKDYFIDTSFLKHFHILAIDRPGYGYSGFGEPLTSIQAQAAVIKDMMDKMNDTKHPVILVAGSYGTSIACRLVMDNPDIADGMILTGPSLGPGLEHVYWFTSLVENPLINWFIPRMFKSANREKIMHEEELTKMLPYWKNIHIPVTYLQGEKDELIDTANASFARENATNIPYLYIHFFPGKPHFIPFSEHDFIEWKIFEMEERVRKSKVQ